MCGTSIGDRLHLPTKPTILLASSRLKTDNLNGLFAHLWFKQSIGTTSYKYPIEQRVEREKQLLKEKERSIKEARSRLFDINSLSSRENLLTANPVGTAIDRPFSD